MDILEIQKWAFMPGLPDNITPIRDLLVRYSRIPTEQIDSHLIKIVSCLALTVTASFFTLLTLRVLTARGSMGVC